MYHGVAFLICIKKDTLPGVGYICSFPPQHLYAIFSNFDQLFSYLIKVSLAYLKSIDCEGCNHLLLENVVVVFHWNLVQKIIPRRKEICTE